MNELNIKEIQKDLPQLIVALDSLDDIANYIHINDAKERIIYYCPCCKGIIKPRAYKEDKEYQVQAHFYHDEGGCNEEAFVHYICKTWLFENGCKFKINNDIHIVEKIETEKTYHTEFGDYRPDITVFTTDNQIYFFEIKNTNRKTEHYIPKWDALGKPVVEVDVRYFINQKIENDVPEFKLIYSDGECFIKSYTRKDYDDVIAKRKIEWKRQDKLNYKMMWEKLDWFWIEVQKYKTDNTNSEELLKAFKSLDFYDIEDCWSILNRMSCCKNIKDECRNIVNNKSKEKGSILLSEIKNKYNDKLFDLTLNCEPRKDLYINYRFADEYILDSNYYTFYITCENRSWIILPSKIIALFNDFKSTEDKIILHCNNVGKIKQAISWNNAPMLFDENIFGKRISSSSIYSRYYGRYIENADTIINQINSNIINEVSKVYASNFCMCKYEVQSFINGCIYDFDIIYKLMDSYSEYNECGFKYKGEKVIIFHIDDSQIVYKNKEYNYIFSQKSLLKEFVIECIYDALTSFNNVMSVIDMVSDIKRFSNEIWRFDLDIDKKSVKITLNYTIPYYEVYTKKISADIYVDVSDMFSDKFQFIDYYKEVNLFLNKRIAPAMEALIYDEITKYNNSHITSALCRFTEVKKYDQ